MRPGRLSWEQHDRNQLLRVGKGKVTHTGYTRGMN